MNLNRSTLFICYILLPCTLKANGITESIKPQTWIQTYLCDSKGTLVVSQQDMQVLLNVLYFSYARSAITLEAQIEGLSALQTAWQTYQNIIQLRRNPANIIPYVINENEYAQEMESLYELQTEHVQIGKTYTHTVNAILHDTLITDKHLTKGIQSLRDDARRLMSHALGAAQEYLAALLHKRIEIDGKPVDAATKRFSINDYLLALIPNLAITSFVKTDDLTISMSQECWKSLYQVLTISSMIWKSIEKARAQLYLNYYTAVYHQAKLHGMNMKRMRIMFDDQGLLEPALQREQLPDPSHMKI